MGIRYCTREQVKTALDVQHSRRVDRQIDRLIDSASRTVEELCRGRKFYTVTDTRYFDWPPRQRRVPSWRLWLDQDEVQSVTTLTAGGTAITDYFLEPVNDGPPYHSIELDRSADAAFTTAASGTSQRAIAVTGRFGGYDGTEQVSTVSGTLTAAHAYFTISPEQVGVGDTLKIDDELVHLTDVEIGDTSQDLQADLTASTADVAVSVTDGTGFLVDEVLYIDSEAMLVTAISGNTLTVKRAYDSTVLAAHTSTTDIYAYRKFTASRGAVGTTAAAHSDGTAVYKLTYPPKVTELAVAEAIIAAQNEQSGFARMMTNWSGRSLQAGMGIDALRDDTQALHGRRRVRAMAV